MKYFFLLSTISCLMASCSRSYYVPNTHSIPMHDSIEDATIMLTSGGPFIDNEKFHMVNLSAEYSVADNWLMSASYTHFPDADAFFGEIGGGYYTRRGFGYAQILGSVGYGDASIHWYKSGEGNSAQGDVNNYFSESSGIRATLTPALALDFQYIVIAFSPRISYLSYFDISETINGEPYLDEYRLNNFPQQLFLEPSFTLRGKYRAISLQLQVIFPRNLTSEKIPQVDNSLTVGIMLDID